MSATDPIIPEPRRLSIRLPRPLWIGVATAVLVVAGVGLRIGLPIYRRAVAIREIRLLGGNVRVLMSGPHWFTEIVPDGWKQVFGTVHDVNMAVPAVTDAHLRLLRDIPDVEGIALSESQVTDAGLAQLIELERLEGLMICHTQHVTDAGLKHIARIRRLQYLNVVGCRQVTQEALRLLKTLRALVSQ